VFVLKRICTDVCTGNMGGNVTMGGMNDMAVQTEREQCAWPPAQGISRSRQGSSF
jgi:hypothetical protein